MNPLTVMNALWRAARSVPNTLLDAMPPYNWVEGRLDAKEISPDGAYFILVEEEIMEVDWLTFDKLMMGEALRIRCTRDNRAISIDRLIG